MYEPIPYPSWRYHRTLDPVIVNDPAEDEALGEGWADTPAAFLSDPEPELSGDAQSDPEPATEPGNNEPAADEPAPKKRGKRAAK